MNLSCENYRSNSRSAKMLTKRERYSALQWGIMGVIVISVIFYLAQALGMQSWSAPINFTLNKWYFVFPLVAGFGTQMGLFRAIHLLNRHGGGIAMATSGGVSSSAMLACCMHNLTVFLPILGASGLATFFAAYQSQVFIFSILIVLVGVVYMFIKYKRSQSNKKADRESHQPLLFI